MDLVLILARELASNLATATFIVNPEGTLVYFNEAAEALLGETYANTGDLEAGEWGTMWRPEDPGSGEAIPSGELPLSISLKEHRPSHRRMRIVGLDEIKRSIDVTAYPLLSHRNEMVGAVAIFWEENG